MSEQSVRDQIDKLQEAGFVTLMKTGGGTISNRYKITPTTGLTPQRRGGVPLNRMEGSPQPHGGVPLNGVERNPHLTPIEPKGGKENAPLPFLARLEKVIERSKEECQKLVRSSAIDHSLNGRTWKSPDAKAKYDEWKKREKEASDQIRKGEYQT